MNGPHPCCIFIVLRFENEFGSIGYQTFFIFLRRLRNQIAGPNVLDDVNAISNKGQPCKLVCLYSLLSACLQS